MNPKISVIVPCYNERATIARLLQGISNQTYPKEDLEVIVADGISTDGTRDTLNNYSERHPELSLFVIENPTRIIPAALNLAIAKARGDVIVRLDAHSIPRADYLERCIEALEETGAANVGGLWEIKPSEKGWIPAGIAIAAAHPLGAGNTRYRTGGTEGKVDTVPFGAFRREWLDRIGLFNEKLLTNEDYEYNVRIREAGGVVWFDPSIRSVYFARGTLRELAGQYARYGFWKAQMLRSFPETLRWRQALPQLFVLTTLTLALAAPFSVAARLLLSVGWGLYALTLLVLGMLTAFRRGRVMFAVGIPLALLTMHLFWGLGAVWGMIYSLFKRPASAS